MKDYAKKRSRPLRGGAVIALEAQVVDGTEVSRPRPLRPGASPFGAVVENGEVPIA
jgi:hypothetical protein